MAFVIIVLIVLFIEGAAGVTANESGLCQISSQNDCNIKSICKDDNGKIECPCKAGYKEARLSKKYCEDKDECVKFSPEEKKELCVHGECLNTIGAWNCSCPADRQWQSVGNETYAAYRCQGNYSYIGTIDAQWTGNKTIPDIKNIVAQTIRGFFQNSTIEEYTYDVPVKSLVVGVSVLKFEKNERYVLLVLPIDLCKQDYSSRHERSQSCPVNQMNFIKKLISGQEHSEEQKYTTTFNIRMGEIVDTYTVLSVFREAVPVDVTVLTPNELAVVFDNYHIFNESENVLCELSNNGDCNTESTECQQYNGSTHCICKRGFTKILSEDKFCEDVDECSDGIESKNCSYGKCRNIYGGYTCDCDEGYARNDSDPWNIICEDINECTSNGYTCQNGTCINTDGGWNCSCDGSGFVRIGLKPVFFCIDIDECSNKSYKCWNGKGNCTNSFGSWSCTCPSGYTKKEISPSNVQCEDIDECKEFKKNNTSEERCVHGTCENTPGSWNCSCHAGRTRQNVGNQTYPIYRCQGDYQYIGEVKLLWIQSTIQRQQLENFLNKTIRTLFLEKEDNDRSIPKALPRMGDIFLYEEYLNATFDNRTTGFVSITASYILHLGETVSPEWVEKFQSNAFNKSNGDHVTILASTILNESGYNLCSIPKKTNCNLSSTDCIVHNGSYSCTCKSGFPNRIDDHNCKDIDECNETHVVCQAGECRNTVGSWECLCNDTSVFNRTSNSTGVCKDIDECHNDSYKCNAGHCADQIGGWDCTCDAGYYPKEIIRNKTYTCTDIDECDDEHDGICSNGGSCNNTLGNWTCDCLPGFQVHYQNTSFIECIDIDECDGEHDTTCLNGGNCSNSPGTWTCNCSSGFNVLHINESFIDCQDINECNDESFKCHNGNCTNEKGGWKCICDPGYFPQEIMPKNIYTCTDIDECDGKHKVTCLNGGTCGNIPGNWTCQCPPGFEINHINESFIECRDIDECQRKEQFSCEGDNNSSYCNNSYGSWECNCKNGYKQKKVSETARICEDINECTTGVKCSNGGSCVNTPGSWTCKCKPGFEIHYRNESFIDCKDINECQRRNIFSCEGDNNSSYCTNSLGSWKCNCRDGYRQKNVSETARICEDIDECEHGLLYCHNGHCINTAGSWYCECPEGFTNLTDESRSNNTTCKDIDECIHSSISCIEASGCKNTVGSWKCICSEGLTETIINKTSKLCAGDYQYVASVSFTLTGEITDVATIEIEIKKKILDMYIDSFEESDVWIEILKITGLPGYSRKRRSVPDVHDIQTEYIVHTKEEKTEEQLNNVETVYRKSKCDEQKNICHDDIGGFTMQLAEVQTKNSSAICDTNKNVCDKKTSTCFSSNGQLECNCSQGYTKPDKNSLRCIDIDECKRADACPNTTTCSNKVGTWDCSCKDGLKAIETVTGKKECKDPCEYTEYHKTSTSTHEDNDDGYICGCEKGRKGKYCNEIDSEYKESELQTTIIVLGSNVGGLVLILTCVIIGMCRWKVAKVKEAKKISMRHMNAHGLKHVDDSSHTYECIRESPDGGDSGVDSGGDSVYSHRLSNAPIPGVSQNDDVPYISLHRYGNGNIPESRYARLQNLPKPHDRDSTANQTNGDVSIYRSDSRRVLDQKYKRDSAARNVNDRTPPTSMYDMSISPKTDDRPFHDNNRLSLAQLNHHRQERYDVVNDNGMGNDNSGRNDYIRPIYGRGYPNVHRHGDTRF